jgi:response regulator RpfG family c-di-GMP phosphodiesterase
MSLLEGANVGARGHAHSVAKYCRLVGQRMGLTRRELDALTVAALLHDLGSLETKRQIGEPLFSGTELLPATVRATLDMLANTPFPFQVTELINAAADIAIARPNPEARQANNLARAANILRVADGYDSLRRDKSASQQTDDEIFEHLRRQPTGVFDIDVLETFIHMRKNEQAISAMNIFWAAALIVDPNPDEQQLLRLRLENDDFHVLMAKSVDEALHILHSESVTLVISENQLSGRGDGFELLRTMRGDPALRTIPFVFHAFAETDLVRYALELGAEDWLPKPHNVEIMAMKLQRVVSRRHTSSAAGGSDGVHGSLQDMGIIEMVQILNSGSRSVQMLMENAKRSGELTLQHGQIISATCGELTGEQAALELLSWEDGQFRILPLRQVPPVTIRTSADNLLLQSCYQKDKKNSPESRGLRP